MGKFLTFLIALAWVSKCPAFTQQNWHWVFGDSLQMHFWDGLSPAIDSEKSHVSVLESVASISDSSGLLLYMDHDSIYDKYHRGISSTGQSGLDDASCTNGSLILPDPGNAHRFHCFYLIYTPDTPMYTLKHSVVEKSEDSESYLAVVEGENIARMSWLTEKLSAVRHSNGHDWWVVTQKYSSDTMRVMLLDDTGISSTANVATGITNDHPVGEAVFSPTGQVLAAVDITGFLRLYEFDRCQGDISAIEKIDLLVESSYGLQFSPSGRYLYISEGVAPNSPQRYRILQFDMTNPDILSSMVVVYQASVPNITFGQMQIGPDNKIYVAGRTYPPDEWGPSSNSFHLSVIHDPDSAGIACNFEYNALYLGGRRAWFGLPNQPNYNLGSLAAQAAQAGPNLTVCILDTFELGINTPLQPGISAQWISSISGWMESPTELGTRATTTASGWWYLTVTDSSLGAPCGVTMDSVWVTVQTPPVLPALADTTICEGDSIMLTVPSQNGVSYQWTPSIGLSDHNSPTTWANPIVTTSYTVIATDTSRVGSCKTVSEALSILIDPCEAQEGLFLPTVISNSAPGAYPQGIEFRGLDGTVELWVWDVRGRLIYHSRDYHNDLRAEWLRDAVYLYRVKAGEMDRVMRLGVF